jgi:predicted rRNA methylase YqxC with S4 and FtsJ domains
VLAEVTSALATDGLAPVAVMPSPLRGASGNVEFLGHFRVRAHVPPLPVAALEAAVEEAHR